VRPVSVFPFFGGGWKKELRTALLLLLGVIELALRLEVSVIAECGCLREAES
jgi:hypothetical protein